MGMTQEKTAAKRVRYVDFLKGVGIFLVVFAHCWLRSDTSFWAIYRFHMPLFFLISGYLFSPKGSFLKFTVRKVQSLLLPYVVFFFYSAFVTHFIIGKSNTVKELAAALFFGGKRLTIVNNWALWYFQLFFIASILFWLVVKSRVHMLAAASLFFIAAPLWSKFTISHMGGQFTPFTLQSLFAALFFMSVGCFCKNHPFWRLSVTNKRLHFFICILVMGLGYGISIGNQEQIISIRSYIFCASALMIIWGFVNLTLGASNDYLVFLGKNSLYILGMHRPILAVLQKTQLAEKLQKMHITGDVSAFLITLLTVFIILFICLIYTSVVDYIKLKRKKN